MSFGSSEGWQDLLHGQLAQDFQIANLSSCQPSNLKLPKSLQNLSRKSIKNMKLILIEKLEK